MSTMHDVYVERRTMNAERGTIEQPSDGFFVQRSAFIVPRLFSPSRPSTPSMLTTANPRNTQPANTSTTGYHIGKAVIGESRPSRNFNDAKTNDKMPTVNITGISVRRNSSFFFWAIFARMSALVVGLGLGDKRRRLGGGHDYRIFVIKDLGRVGSRGEAGGLTGVGGGLKVAGFDGNLPDRRRGGPRRAGGRGGGREHDWRGRSRRRRAGQSRSRRTSGSPRRCGGRGGWQRCARRSGSRGGSGRSWRADRRRGRFQWRRWCRSHRGDRFYTRAFRGGGRRNRRCDRRGRFVFAGGDVTARQTRQRVGQIIVLGFSHRCPRLRISSGKSRDIDRTRAIPPDAGKNSGLFCRGRKNSCRAGCTAIIVNRIG